MGRRSGEGGFLARGGLWVLAQGLIFLLILLTPQLGLLRLPLWARLAGLAPLALAAWLGTGGLLALGRSLTIFPKPLSDATLVRHGPYGRVRHPLYGALILGTLGLSLGRGHLPGMILSLLLGIFFDRKSRHEERLLEARYPEYPEYRRETPRRLIPWIY